MSAAKKRIPPKGTPGYTAYWGDRFDYERIEQLVKDYSKAAGDGTTPRHAMFRSVAASLQQAADTAKLYHQTTDYFAFNERKNDEQ